AGTPQELLQIKHHLRRKTDLTLQSVDLWRSMNSWLDALPQMPRGVVPHLRLLTTASIPAKNPLVGLRSGPDRNPDLVLAALVEAAASGKSKATAAWRKAFLARSEGIRSALVRAIVIQDGSVSAENIDDRLREVVLYGLRRGREKEIIDQVLG